MRFELAIAAAALLIVSPAFAGDEPGAGKTPFTTLDLCSLKGRGVDVGNGVCVKVRGGIGFRQTWGNASGGEGTGLGQSIVQTPAGNYTIPALD